MKYLFVLNMKFGFENNIFCEWNSLIFNCTGYDIEIVLMLYKTVSHRYEILNSSVAL